MDRFHQLPALHVLSRLLIASLSAVILLAAFVGYPPRSASAAAAHPDSCSMQSTTAFSTPDNPDSGWGVVLNDGIDSNPNALVLVTYNALGDDAGTSTRDPHPLGVWYDQFFQQWEIWNEDDSPMPNGAAFNVLTMDPSCSDRAFVHTATAANSVYDYTGISSPLTDNQPFANLLVTHNFSPGGNYSYIRDPHPLGVFYDYSSGHWAIFHQDLTPIPAGASYNVFVVNNNVNCLCSPNLHQATYGNTDGNETWFNDPKANGNLGAQVYVTANFSPDGPPFTVFHPGPGIYVNANLGVTYDTRRGTTNQWAIFTEDDSAMPIGAFFNVLVL